MDRYNSILIDIKYHRPRILNNPELHGLEPVVYAGKQEMEALVKVATDRAGETHPKEDLRLNGMRVLEVDAETHLAIGHIIQGQGYWN